LDLEADLQGPIPRDLEPLTRAHGGPLTEPLPGSPARVSALAPDALSRATNLFLSGAPGLVWTDVEDTLNGSTFRAGAVSFTGAERRAAVTLRRAAQLSRYWGHLASTLRPVAGAQPKLPAPAITVRQLATASGVSFATVTNIARTPWTGELKLAYPAVKRFLALPSVTVPAQDSLRLPVGVPLMAGPLCHDCTAFATPDHLIYATAELTAMEYENGILAMEFYAPTAGEVLLQLSREPAGPLVAGGLPAPFKWDDSAKRVRLTIPAGPTPTHRVRIALAIEAPDATAYFPSARVLVIGEENRLTAQYSSEGISQRSRLIARSAIEIVRDATDPKTPLESVYHLTPAATLTDGDTADIAIEADGARLSHAQPRLRLPATLTFSDPVGVRLAANSTLPLHPATLPLNQRLGGEINVLIHNNAPAIRTFRLELKAQGIEFSPPTTEVTVGYAATRTVTFRAFAASAAPGLHTGEARLSGAAATTEPIRFVVIPQNGAVAWQADGFSFLESLHQRAAFLPGRWLEFITKENGHDALPAGGIAFQPGAQRTNADELIVSGPTPKSFRLRDLDALVPKPAR
ncbi:MAG TPA: hypothetical protein VNH18_02145, partial [Bryobacteraceae bacterium]|nr:hypothetical protein [Bryobacteraceae bacterium]